MSNKKKLSQLLSPDDWGNAAMSKEEKETRSQLPGPVDGEFIEGKENQYGRNKKEEYVPSLSQLEMRRKKALAELLRKQDEENMAEYNDRIKNNIGDE